MSAEELEFILPLTIVRKEKKDMPCPDCSKVCYNNVRYHQAIWRHDDFGMRDVKNRSRKYTIVYRNKKGEPLFMTERHHSLRDAFVESLEKLDDLGIENLSGYGKAELSE
jgi:hypothetical protein